jgi:hypothetical protein
MVKLQAIFRDGSFIHFIFLVCSCIVIFVYVIHNLTTVPDDDPRMGSKHVGLAYRDCNIQYLKKNNKTAFVS